MRAELNTFLSSHTKEEIEAILDYFGQSFSKSARKSDLASALGNYMSDDSTEWLDRLMESDLKLLRKLCRAGIGKSVTFIRPDYPSVVEVLHLVTVEKMDDDNIELSISEPMFNLISPVIEDVIDRKESDGSFEVERLILGCLNIYGILPLRTFVNRIFEDVGSDEDAIHLSEIVSVNPLIRLYQEEYKGEYYIVSPFVENFEEILEMRRITFKGIRKYAKMTRPDAISCGSFAPNCAYGLYTEEGQALIEMLESIGYSGEELAFQLHSVWMSSQYAIDEEATEVLFSPVTSAQQNIPSFSRFKECIDTIVKYSNSVPKWLLKGQSAKECGHMLLAVRTEDLQGEYTGPIEESIPEELKDFYNLGMLIPPVEPYAPCPCGSGFSYCFCHGRKNHLS